jgi:phosphoenolpyruvate---glycerone phosphotransferase subunit DhaL
MDRELLLGLVEAVRRAVAERAAELDALDAAIGDGDHGANLARGLAAVAARAPELAALPLAGALPAMGSLLAGEAGGDGGRIYGALLRGMGGAAPPADPTLADLARMLDAGVEAARAEGGGSRAGDKTLLDVLEPAAHALRAELAEGRPGPAIASRVVAAAAFGLHRTSRLVAKHGRAADLGAASVNHLDPGAWSAALMVGAVVGVLERRGAAAPG